MKRPKPLFILAASLISMFLISACASPISPLQVWLTPGSVVTEELEFQSFDQVEIQDSFNVKIHQGDTFSVKVEVDKASAPYLQVKKVGDTLKIGLRPRFGFFNLTDPTLEAEITMPNLVGTTASDVSHVEVSGFSTDKEVRFNISDASSLEGDMDTGDTQFIVQDVSTIMLRGDHQDIEVEASDASHITLQGEGKNATVTAADMSQIDLEHFTLQDATIVASDASNIRVDAQGLLNAEARDMSGILYYGDPTIGRIISSDASSVNPG